MTQCPSCTQSINVTDDNYGTLYRCEHCQAEFFIGFDGMPENSKEPNVSEEAPANIPQIPSVQSSGDIYNIDPASSDIYAMNSNEVESNRQSEASSERSPSGAFKDYSQEVTDFGNDSVTAGILSFDIEISGIDLAEMKRDLLEALDDQRFGWNLPELSQKINDGKLIIKNISAPKIIVLVKRITPIGLSLNWRHHVSTQ